MPNKDQFTYQNNWIRENYDRLSIQVPKGQKAVIEEHYRRKGYKSLNAYINALIQADMEQSRA